MKKEGVEGVVKKLNRNELMLEILKVIYEYQSGHIDPFSISGVDKDMIKKLTRDTSTVDKILQELVREDYIDFKRRDTPAKYYYLTNKGRRELKKQNDCTFGEDLYSNKRNQWVIEKGRGVKVGSLENPYIEGEYTDSEGRVWVLIMDREDENAKNMLLRIKRVMESEVHHIDVITLIDERRDIFIKIKEKEGWNEGGVKVVIKN